MLTRYFLLVPCVVACTQFKEDTGDSFTTPGSDIGDDGGGGGSEHGGLEDLTQGLSADPACNEFESTALAGASSYFYGLFTQSDAGFSGYELWLLYPNETWRSQGQDDCIIRWNATAFETTPSDSVSADLGLNVTLTLDQAASTCPNGADEIGDLPPTGNVTYSIQVSGESTQWFFESGEPLGSGTKNENSMNYLSPLSCRWF